MNQVFDEGTPYVEPVITQVVIVSETQAHDMDDMGEYSSRNVEELKGHDGHKQENSALSR